MEGVRSAAHDEDARRWLAQETGGQQPTKVTRSDIESGSLCSCDDAVVTGCEIGHGAELKVGPTEFRLLRFLMSRPDRVMTRQGSGHIVNIASLAGLIPFPTNAPYATSKHAVVGLSVSLREEGAALGVKVSAVCPGFIESNIFRDTPFINVPREEILKGVPFKPMDTDLAATRILQGVERNQAIISFPGYARFIWRLYRLWPGLIALLNRRLVRDLRRVRG